MLSVLNTNTRAIALYKRMGWRLTGTVLNVYDPENAAFTEKYCEEWQMRYQGCPLFLSPIHNVVENKLVKLHKRAGADLAELQNPAKFAKFYCTKSTK